MTPDQPAFPPKETEWLPPFIPPFELPGYVFPPPGGVTPPTPPCDPKTDPKCPPPPPPDVPEPATILILIVGLAATWLAFRRPPAARTE